MSFIKKKYVAKHLKSKKKTEDYLTLFQMLGIVVAIWIMLMPLVSDDGESVNENKSESKVEEVQEIETINVIHRVTENLVVGSRPQLMYDEVKMISVDESVEKHEEIEDILQRNNMNELIGNDEIEINGHTLTKFDLPNEYYYGLDYSSFQPYMDYRAVTDPTSTAYYVVYDEGAYVDNYGFRRVKTSDNLQFTVDSKDDYVVGLGTYYKPKGEAGIRYMIVTTTGVYTCTTGDEKADVDTDKLNMFSRHGLYGEYAGLIEWLVDSNKIENSVYTNGTVTSSSHRELQGEILYIYRIDD